MTDATDISCGKAQQSKFCGSTKMFMDEGFKRLAAISHPVHSQASHQQPSKFFQDESNISRFLGQSKMRRFVDLPACLS